MLARLFHQECAIPAQISTAISQETGFGQLPSFAGKRTVFDDSDEENVQTIFDVEECSIFARVAEQWELIGMEVPALLNRNTNQYSFEFAWN